MQKIAKYPCKQLKDFCYITDGEHGSPDWDKATNIKYITAEHIKQNYIVDTVYKTISQNQYKKKRPQCKEENPVPAWIPNHHPLDFSKHFLPNSDRIQAP